MATYIQANPKYTVTNRPTTELDRREIDALVADMGKDEQEPPTVRVPRMADLPIAPEEES
jgi:hypothetical protein